MSSTRWEGEGGSGTRPGPRCPVCAGVLVPLRGVSRCTRCLYAQCEGCEPPHPADFTPPGE